MSRILVVYYSRSGHTKQIAEQLARALAADVEAIADPTDRSGLRGYLRSGFEATTQRVVPIAACTHDPNDYELVVIGTPIWGMSVSAPVRSYLHRYQDRLRKVAFFCTCGGSGGERAFAQMSRACGLSPAATLIVREAELPHAEPKIAQLVRQLGDAVTAGPSPRADGHSPRDSRSRTGAGR
ncbi:MAG: flavodoxin family protein [Acidobacteriota bacterium]